MMGIGLMLVGLIVGAIIGFNWMPRDAVTTENDGENQPS